MAKGPVKRVASKTGAWPDNLTRTLGEKQIARLEERIAVQDEQLERVCRELQEERERSAIGQTSDQANEVLWKQRYYRFRRKLQHVIEDDD